MKIIKKLFFLVCIICLTNCVSYKAKKQEALLALPELGTLVKTKGDLFYNAVEEIGQPDWGTIKVDIKELPFNIESYVNYATHMQRAGKINTIPYNDSLRYKPKYVRLQLTNKIDLATKLNSDKNGEVRYYLSQDDDHRLVTALDVALTEGEIQHFIEATGVQLEKDRLDNMVLVVFSANKESSYLLKNSPVFNYTLSTFCWGEDQFGNPRIENITTEDLKCPKNTYAKASKIKANKSYLKF